MMIRRIFSMVVILPLLGSAVSRGEVSSNVQPRTPERAKKLAELMDEKRLFDRGARRVYRGDHLKAISMPVGGIAAGPIQINGEARRHIWQIFRNYQGVSLPDSVFAVRVGKEERVLQTVGEVGLAPMKALSFSGEYPFGWYTFEEPALPVRVSMEVFSPLIPLNVKDSSIPCAIFNLTAENTGDKPVDVRFLATQQNPIGYQLPNPIHGRASKTYGGNINTVLKDAGGTIVHLNSNRPTTDGTYGDLALATPAAGAVATANWNPTSGFDLQSVLKAGPTPAGKTVNAAIAVPFVLQPGEKRTVTFVLAWHFSNTGFMVGKQRRTGNMYANWWPDALGVARDVTKRLKSLTAQTRLYHDALYRTNLPYWLLDRMSSQVAILRSMTCHWAKDGFFYAFEGCRTDRGCCEGNATHVWGYPQAHARLFPEIARRMREEAFASMKPDGMIATRFAFAIPPRSAFNPPAFDGMCHEISATLREHQIYGDPAWLVKQWPHVKKVLNSMIAHWDKDEDGMLSGPQHAMDGYQGGTTSWLGSTYLCALAAATTMASEVNDTAAADRYGKILEAGRANQDKALFNGEYFIQIPDKTPQQDYLTGCYIDQMLGQWWARQIGLGWLYPPQHVRSAMDSLFRYNFRTDFHGFKQAPRVFCADDDAGMIQCTWPKGGRPKPPHCIRYTKEVMSGFEYAAACLMIQSGLLPEGFTVLRAAADRYDGRLRHTPQSPPYDKAFANWEYTGNPFGDDECGKFYARAMAIWSVLPACQGFEYNASSSHIGFAPIWKPEDHHSFFTAAEGWGNYSQKMEGGRMTAKIAVKWGKLRLKTIALAGKHGGAVRLSLNGQPVPASVSNDQGRVQITLAHEVTVAEGEALEVIYE